MGVIVVVSVLVAMVMAMLMAVVVTLCRNCRFLTLLVILRNT